MESTVHSNFERRCRLCAEEQDVTIMLFSPEAREMLLQDKLSKYLLIEIPEDDKLPRNICIKCCNKVQGLCEFVEGVQNAQETLQNLADQNEINETLLSELKQEPVECHEINIDPMEMLKHSDDLLHNKITDILPYSDVVTLKLIKKETRDNKLQKPFPCTVCKKSFVSDIALKNHSWNHSSENNVQNACNICYETFAYKTELVMHLKTHKTAGVCQLCGRRFRSEKTYTEHMSVHLSSWKNCFTCKVCNRTYGSWAGLRSHSVSHSTERPFQCPYCKKGFKRNQELKFHMNQHTGDKPFKCPFCDKTFASSGNCSSHRKRVHPGLRIEANKRWSGRDIKMPVVKARPKSNILPGQGIQKYQCQYCQRSFAKRDSYVYHMYQHTGEKPFKCSVCPEKFVTRKGLLIHHNKTHSKKDRPLGLLSKNVILGM